MRSGILFDNLEVAPENSSQKIFGSESGQGKHNLTRMGVIIFAPLVRQMEKPNDFRDT
ncbi:hypothetical protein [Aerosakkonema funiforme]|uniref:hypothetical protein n=1 Tax=Aerosakkonema funiforme TaxID=1246630 RepID=UPI0035BC961C